MKDLTQGSIPKHLVTMAIPIAIGMFVQTLYYLVDLYFVGKLGDTALAGVSTAGNAMFLILGLTQILNVGTAALISHAVGRKDKADANLIFNQSLVLALILGMSTLVGFYAFADDYLGLISDDAATITAGLSYFYWFIPCMALQFALVVMGAALRGTGIVKPTMMVQMVTVLINIALAPILIAGWGTGIPMGVAGAGLASSIAVVVGVIMLAVYFHKLEKYVSVDRELWRPKFDNWKRILNIGLPAGGEFVLMFMYMATIYWAIQGFGADAQAGFGLGSRIMQALFLPALALAFAAPAVAGQNYGAQNAQRVRETFKWTAILSSVVMVMLTLVCLKYPQYFLQGFSDDDAVLLVSVTFLQMICWNFLPSGLIFTCSGLFQAMGNTWPAMLSTGTRLLTFAIPAIWLSQQPHFGIEQLWQLSVLTVFLQAGLSLFLLRQQFSKRLKFEDKHQSVGAVTD